MAESEVLKVLVKEKSKIFLQDGRIVGKNAYIWKALSAELNGNLSARTLYAKTCDPSFRMKLDPNSSKEDEESQSTMCMPIDKTDSSKINSSLEESDLKFKLFADRLEFEKFIIEKEYDCQNKDRKRLRRFFRLKPGEWEEWLSDLIFDATKMKCGFNFVNHTIRADQKRGSINGDMK